MIWKKCIIHGWHKKDISPPRLKRKLVLTVSASWTGVIATFQNGSIETCQANDSSSPSFHILEQFCFRLPSRTIGQHRTERGAEQVNTNSVLSTALVPACHSPTGSFTGATWKRIFLWQSTSETLTKCTTGIQIIGRRAERGEPQGTTLV